MGSVSKFLEKKRPARPNCHTCKHPKVAQINKACAEFQTARDAGTTTVTWTEFTKHYLKKEHGYDHNIQTLKAHLEGCLGQEDR